MPEYEITTGSGYVLEEMDVDEIEASWIPDDWAIWDDIDRNPGDGYEMQRPE